MNLVSSWSHYLDFQCDACGEITNVDVARNFTATVVCRSSKCRTSLAKLGAIANDIPAVQIGMPTG